MGRFGTQAHRPRQHRSVSGDFDDPNGHLLEIITRSDGTGGTTTDHPHPLGSLQPTDRRRLMFELRPRRTVVSTGPSRRGVIEEAAA